MIPQILPPVHALPTVRSRSRQTLAHPTSSSRSRQTLAGLDRWTRVWRLRTLRTGFAKVWRLRLLLVCLALLQLPLHAGESPTPATSGATSAATGVIYGTVTYHPDSARPWRYARYYVKDRKTGALAEAVVALSSRSLRNLAPPEEPTVWEIHQKDFRFDPETIAIRAGDSVRFTNGDPTVHNVRTSDGSNPFNVNIANGAEHVQEFARAGGIRRPIRVGCVLHSTMRAWIYVFDHPFYKLTESDGAFRFEDVPPGEYTLQMVHPSGELSWSREVTIEPGAETQADIEVSPDNLTSEKDK